MIVAKNWSSFNHLVLLKGVIRVPNENSCHLSRNPFIPEPRHGADSSDSDQGESVTAPPFETWHDTWDTLVARLDEYQAQHRSCSIYALLLRGIKLENKEEVAGSRADP
ncbi:hypothetical protein GQ600_24232 [Phytophthora cactorum]|nr:hypothetical protein GQ600_24232 [Phytophthora cactorum]